MDARGHCPRVLITRFYFTPLVYHFNEKPATCSSLHSDQQIVSTQKQADRKRTHLFFSRTLFSLPRDPVHIPSRWQVPNKIGLVHRRGFHRWGIHGPNPVPDPWVKWSADGSQQIDKQWPHCQHSLQSLPSSFPSSTMEPASFRLRTPKPHPTVTAILKMGSWH